MRGISVSSIYDMLAMQLATTGPNPGQLAAIKKLNEIIQSLSAEDYAAASMALEELEDAALPATLDSLRWLATASVALFEEDPARALSALERAEAIDGEIPVISLQKSYAHLQAGQYEESLAEARAFGEIC